MTTQDEILGFVSPEPEMPNTFYCWAVLRDIDKVKKDEFVVITDAKRKDTIFIGQVIDINNQTIALKSFSREEMLRSGIEAEQIIKGALSRPEYFKVYAKVKLLYKVIGNNILSVDTPPTDTSPIVKRYLDLLSMILGFSSDRSNSICIGKLYANKDIDVCLDLNKMLSGHIAIFGQTGSGKSYAAGVIIEEVTSRGVPVVVFDHMGEYLSMSKAADGGKGINIIHLVPGSNITLDFEDIMKAPQILLSLGITDAQLNLLKDAYTEAVSHGFKGLGALKWLLIDVPTQKGARKRLYLIGRNRGYSTATIDGLRWKLEALLSRGIIGQGFDIKNVIKPGHLTIIDLTNVDASNRSLVVATILSKIAEGRKQNLIPPLLVVIEEAHNYVTRDETPSSLIIRDFIRGARHWGTGVMLISQRPAGLHTDALNIVNTHIIFRLKGTDLEYIKQFAPLTKEELEDIQRLPEGVAYITGPIIRGGLTVKVAIRKRRTMHGGESVKFT
ncbi:MAG: ATP-binding protein [Desulfurococcaceae archaeon]|nr:ATP-binding protein [Desulfurococcaceae archaeon]